MNRPQEVLLNALVEDLGPVVDKLRAVGWPAEVVVAVEAGAFRVSVVVDLSGIRVPVEAVPLEPSRRARRDGPRL